MAAAWACFWLGGWKPTQGALDTPIRLGLPLSPLQVQPSGVLPAKSSGVACLATY